MTKYLLMLFFTLTTLQTNARCLDTRVIWPKPGKINLNNIFVIEEGTGFNKHLYTIQSEIKANGLFLKSGKSKIELVIVATYTNSLGLEQVVLKPKTSLKPNSKYKLVTRDGKPYYIYSAGKGKAIWITKNKTDDSPPAFNKPPAINKETTQLVEGGWESHFAVFDFNAKDESNCIIKVKIINKESGEFSELICFPIKDQIWLGIDECYFGYEFKRKKDYEISFELIDSSLNSTKATTDTYTFRRQK